MIDITAITCDSCKLPLPHICFSISPLLFPFCLCILLSPFVPPTTELSSHQYLPTTGGESTWRQFLTLPNILKLFNPRLSGYSVGKGEFLSPNAHMNVAIPVSADSDALKQAKMLVSKMRKERSVDFNNDWKVSMNRLSKSLYIVRTINPNVFYLHLHMEN